MQINSKSKSIECHRLRQSRPLFCTTPRAFWPFKMALEEVVLVRCFFLRHRYDNKKYIELEVASRNMANTVIKRRAEFLAGRVCAMSALRLFGCEPAMPGVGKNREPLWSSEIVGSITHTDSVAGAVVAASHRYAGIGIDCETLIDNGVCENLLSDILTFREREYYSGLSVCDRARFFTVAFSAKESLFKALFLQVGFYFDFQCAEITDLDIEKGALRIALTADLTDRFRRGIVFDGLHCLIESYVVTLIAIEK